MTKGRKRKKIEVLLSLRTNGLDSLFKEVRVLKEQGAYKIKLCRDTGGVAATMSRVALHCATKGWTLGDRF